MDVIEWLKLRTNDARPFTSADIKAVLSEVEWLRAELARAREERDLARDKITRLQVGDGPTFDELRKAGKIGGGAPYLFEELVDIARAPAPPLVFLHIPRTGGHTLNQILKRNYKVRATSYGASFFPSYFPRQFLSLVQPPETEDDRDRPAFFGGHIDIENKIFDYMPVRYVALTILRDPVKRIISHYRFNSTKASIFQDAIQSGLDVLGYLERFRAAVPQQYELFSPNAALLSAARVKFALDKLERAISFFGLQEDYDQLLTMLEALLGLSDVPHKRLNELPPGAAKVTPQQEEDLRSLLQDDIAFYDGAKAIYERRIQLLKGKFRLRPHPWTRFYA